MKIQTTSETAGTPSTSQEMFMTSPQRNVVTLVKFVPSAPSIFQTDKCQV